MLMALLSSCTDILMNNFENYSHYFNSNVLVDGGSAHLFQGNSQSFRMAHWLSSYYDGSSQLNVAHWLWLPIPMALFKYRRHCLEAFSARWLLLVPMLVMAHYGTWWLYGSLAPWLQLACNGIRWLLKPSYGFQWLAFSFSYSWWLCMVSHGLWRNHGSCWLRMASNGLWWLPMVIYCSWWIYGSI